MLSQNPHLTGRWEQGPGDSHKRLETRWNNSQTVLISGARGSCPFHGEVEGTVLPAGISVKLSATSRAAARAQPGPARDLPGAFSGTESACWSLAEHRI